MTHKLDAIDKAILRFVQDDLPLTHRPYTNLAGETGLTEEEICVRLRKMRDSGVIRRFGAILRHDKAGYGANAMVVWKIHDGMQDEAASVLAANDSVSHLYSRPAFPDWQCNLFSMIHAKTDLELDSLLLSLEKELSPYSEANRVFRSVQEFKKTSMKYFSEDND